MLKKTIAAIIAVLAVPLAVVLPQKGDDRAVIALWEKYTARYKLKEVETLQREQTRRKYGKRRFGIRSPDQLMHALVQRRWFKQKSGRIYTKEEIISINDSVDLSSIKDAAQQSINSVVVLLGEIPSANRRAAVFAPVFMSDQKKIFDSITDCSFLWVGYKATLKFKQNKFPARFLSLQETLIGSFVYASGTNLGVVGGRFTEENRFYTNYVSEILTLRCSLPLYCSFALSLDSRQYFFIKRNPPADFIMPRNHYNLFPRFDFNIEYFKEKGIDQLFEGVRFNSWIGYGVRNRWEKWGEPDDLQPGPEVRKFIIYSLGLETGLLGGNNHNLTVSAKFKGGRQNDFLTRPRFGGTIDNAKLDVVHGFTVDSFRVNEYGLINMHYGFNIFSRLRISLYLDYARVFSPHKQDVGGSGYGFRIIAMGGLPIWITHGIGRVYTPERGPYEQVYMVMTAAGW